MGLLRTIAIIIIVYYAFKFIGRYILPLFVKRMVDNVEKKYKEQHQNQYQDEKAKVGETVIDIKPSKIKESNKNVGDYVDYEELND
jgi:ribosomal protein S17E